MTRNQKIQVAIVGGTMIARSMILSAAVLFMVHGVAACWQGSVVQNW